jgi:hypothetical protein
VNSNGSQDLALVLRAPDTGTTHIYIMDTVSKVLIKHVTLSADVVVKAAVLVPDVNGNGVKDMAVLTVNRPDSEELLKNTVRIMDGLTGSTLKTVNIIKKDSETKKNYPALGLAVLQDMNANGISEVAILLVHPKTRSGLVQVRDALTGSLIKEVTFSKDFAPVALTSLTDLDGNGAGELAALGVNNVTGAFQVEVRDAAKGTLVKDVPLNAAYLSQALAMLSDINGSGMPELAVLSEHANDGSVVVHIRDALNGATVKDIKFFTAYAPRGMVVLPAEGSKGTPKVAVLGEKLTDRSFTLQIRNAKTPATLKSVPFKADRLPRALAAIPSTGAKDAPDLAVIGNDTTSGKILVQLLNSSTGSILSSFNVP